MTFVFLGVCIVGNAQEAKSFSSRMNEIKRSGDYVYAESSAPSEEEAKSACNELLKIEITKYLVSADSQSGSDARIVKDIAGYNCEYLVQPRGEMIRVFGYLSKSNIDSAGHGTSGQRTPTASTTAVPAPSASGTVEPVAPPKVDPSAQAPVQSSGVQPAQPAAQFAAVQLRTDGMQLAKWQTDMLENVVKEPDMMQAKKLLNRYKYQNRIKRLGDRSVTNPRPEDTFYLIFDSSNRPVALLAPSATGNHFDMFSGATVSLENYSGNQYFWFQISK